ncbi:MAG TPA: hypothetical protein VMP67_03685 [Candidatus Limnocylindria bacterium]|nr:hypothetical protein [Candidatus Limnocylindria bacterium]
MTALLRSIALSLCLALVLGAVGGVGAARGSTAEIAFTSPPAEPAYHVVGQPFTLSWQENVESTTRSLQQEEAALDIDGGCAGAAWQAVLASEPQATSVELELTVNRCYRWTVTLTAGETTYSATSPSLRTLKVWTGKLNLYRKGVFSSQHKWDWCVAASVQMMLNIIKGTSDRSRSNQKKYYLYARANDLTPDRIPGADPRGWALALSRYGGGTYQDVNSPSFRTAMRRAAKRMRLTGRPVGILARAGDHAMVLNGFEATADPATTDDYEVTAVRVMGSLWPDYPKYDPPPNTRYTAATFKRRFFSRYDNPFGSARWSVWEGYFVTINP